MITGVNYHEGVENQTAYVAYPSAASKDQEPLPAQLPLDLSGLLVALTLVAPCIRDQEAASNHIQGQNTLSLGILLPH